MDGNPTAYGALVDIGGLKGGDTVLIPAASSSVGLAAIQIANLVGAVSIALDAAPVGSGRPSSQDGARHVIATEEQDLVAEVASLTGGKGGGSSSIRSVDQPS